MASEHNANAKHSIISMRNKNKKEFNSWRQRYKQKQNAINKIHGTKLKMKKLSQRLWQRGRGNNSNSNIRGRGNN